MSRQEILAKRIRLTEEKTRAIKMAVIGAYDNIVIRVYSYIRFLIMNMRILEELEQYLPQEGVVLDVGCGFGLFSFFFTQCAPEREMIGVDINAGRIETALKVREKLALSDQIEFHVSDVADYPFEKAVNAIVVLDLLHHVPEKTALRLLASFYEILPTGGILIIKDITAKPWWKMAFTWLLDKLIDWRAPLRYYTKDEMVALIDEAGFDVKIHHLIDILPYPHILYICRKV